MQVTGRPQAASIADLERYLNETLGLDATHEALDIKGGLPVFLRNLYAPVVERIMDQRCLILIDRGGDEPTALVIAKHMAAARGKWDGPIAYAAESITPYLRRRLIAERIAFVIPGSQAYLPFLATDLSEHFAPRKRQPDDLRPATQAVLLWWIHHGFAVATPSALGERLGYTKMSMSRAFDDLDQLGRNIKGLTVERAGRERRAKWRGGAKDLWEAVLPVLRSPVTLGMLVRPLQAKIPGLPAGLSGLSMHTDLMEPAVPVLAIERTAWAEYRKKHAPAPAAKDEPDAVHVEVWRYAPDLHLIANTQARDVADPLSIYLSLTKNVAQTDERIDAALERLLQVIPWRS
jgi:hypothetical protein